jgi:hypothetical protein
MKHKKKKYICGASLYLNFISTILGCHLYLYPFEDLTKKKSWRFSYVHYLKNFLKIFLTINELE